MVEGNLSLLMIRNRRRKTWRLSGRFYAFLGTAAAAAVAVIFLITHIQTAVVETGELQFETQLPVVLVRDEEVVIEENYGKANLLVQEGTRVEANTPIAQVFNWGYNEKISFELLEKRATIQEYQENALSQEAADTNLAGINASISAKSSEINEQMRRSEGDVPATERELQELMDQKRTYLNDAVAKDRQLEEFAGEEAQLVERITGASKVISSPHTGVVSYFFDGAESALNAERLQELSYADINEILNGSQSAGVRQSASNSQASQPLYRLINNFKWYILVDVDSPMREFNQGNVFTISFDDITGRTYEGTVVGRVAEEQRCMYVLEILDDIGELLSVRRTNARLYAKFEGLKVPVEALTEQNGTTGVTAVTGNGNVFVPVTIEIESGDSAIIAPAEEDTQILRSGVEVKL